MTTEAIRNKINSIKQSIREKSSREARGSGNPNTSDLDRQLANAGRKRKPDDIPKQDTKDHRGKTNPGNVTHPFKPSTHATRQAYKLGPAVRPNINHDKGFSIFPKEEPTLEDYWNLLKWTSMLEGANTLRPDLSDATAAYAHFLNGGGKPRTFSYERYVMNDESGRVSLRNAILEAQDAAIKLWKSNGEPSQFSFSGPAIPCGTNSPNPSFSFLSRAFPYPATENWQKAIGAHTLWLSGNVQVRKNPVNPEATEFKMEMKLNAEDQYNFNPGMSDIASGIKDDVNGRFVIVEFAHGYLNSSTLTRRFSWRGFEPGVASMGITLPRKHNQPKINRSHFR